MTESVAESPAIVRPDVVPTRAGRAHATSIGSGLRFVARLLWGVAPRRIVAIGVALVGIALTEGAALALLFPLLSLVGLVGAAPAGAAMRWVTVALASVGLSPTLGLVLTAYVVLVGTQSLLSRWQSGVAADVEHRVVTAVRTRLYAAIARAEWAFVSRQRLPHLTHVLTSEVDRVGVVTWYLFDWLVTATVAAVYLALACRLAPAMTAAAMAAGAVLGWLVRGRLDESRRSGVALSNAGERLFQAIAEHLAGLKTMRSLGAGDEHERAFAHLAEDLRVVRLESARGYSRLRYQMTLGSTVALAVIVYVAHAVLVLAAARLLVLLFVYSRLMPRLVTLYQRAQTIAHELPAVAVVAETERACEEAAEPPRGTGRPVAFHRGMRFESVTFAYDGRSGTPAVDGVDFVVPAGSTVAIVGPSGAGKSTVADLLAGLLAPDSGRIVMDDVVLGAAERETWRRTVGYVQQDTWFFHDTIRRNLLWARPTASDDEIWAALRVAAADAFVASLPDGLETVLGDRGVLVSGGERQRLAIARALVGRPRLLLLDEATSALDTENEARILRGLRTLGGLTIVMITHRLSLARAAEVVYVMDRGVVVESGSWDALVEIPAGRLAELLRVNDPAATGATAWASHGVGA